MISFSPPRLDERTVEEVGKVLLSGWITTGPRTKEFEEKITAYLACDKTLCLGSATAGMELILRWFGVKEGDEVIVPAYTYCATANVVMHCGATPVMVDANSEDFNVNVAEIMEKISPKTKVIIPVDIGGLPCDYDEILELVRSEEVKSMFNAGSDRQAELGRILVMSDAAHSFGAKYKGSMNGSVCDVAVFSFHAVKNLTTAEGGAVCLNLSESMDCEKIYSELNIMSLHGQSKDALAKTKIGNWKYDVEEPGYKCNMMDIQAAIGLVELDRYEETLSRRKQIIDYYIDQFSQYDWAEIPLFETEQKQSSYHLFLLRVGGISEQMRDDVISRIFEKEVSVNVHFQPLPLLSAYKKRGYKMDDYPQAYAAYANEISLPVYYTLTDDQMATVARAVIESVEEVMENV
jgi:dTDP-4-amino-4,6-dideoxygalactose transaminase